MTAAKTNRSDKRFPARVRNLTDYRPKSVFRPVHLFGSCIFHGPSNNKFAPASGAYRRIAYTTTLGYAYVGFFFVRLRHCRGDRFFNLRAAKKPAGARVHIV